MRLSLKSILLGATALISACSVQPDMVVMSDVNNSDWSEMATLSYDNRTLKECDMSILLHVNRHFEQQSVSLQITMLTPDSLRYTEQVTLNVEQQPQRPSMAATDVELPYRRNLHLKHKGVYVWQITPAQSIEGVESAGIKFQVNN